MEKIINVTIRDKIAVRTNEVIYICGNSDFIVNFDFDDEWLEHRLKTARFIYGGSYTDMVFEGNQCPVPVISDTYNIKVGVFAGDLRTSTPAHVSAKKSILCGSGTPAEPTPDVYNQMMEMFTEGMGKVEAAAVYASQAGKSAVNAAGAEANAKVSETEAKNAQTAAEDAAKRVEDAVVNISWNDLQDKPFGEVKGEEEILPETYFSEDSDAGEWDSMETVFFFNLPASLVVGETYIVTIDGVEHTTEAVAISDDYFVNNGVALKFDGGSILFQEGGTAAYAEYNAIYSPDEAGEEDRYGGYHMIPVTVRIHAATVKTIDTEYLPDVSWNNLVDKPFGDVVSYAEILPETALEYLEAMECFDIPALDVTVGETYLITWNGMEYECVAYQYDDIIFLGGDDDPFSICIEENAAYAEDGSTEVIMGIKHVTKDVDPIEPKYLPTETWTFTLEDGSVIEKKVVIAT